ncbi:MAG: MBL fold metallo-hydrolase [Novosphingobium sp.]|nr:MBL fold metallo-hydrolase [Novosphingobium sp.]
MPLRRCRKRPASCSWAAGGPIARADRAGIATLLTLAGKTYLIDAGEGVVHQLGKAGLQATDVSTVLLTHLHDDHYAGLPALASFAYTLRLPKMTVFGPQGTNALGEGVVAVMMPSARIRMVENHLPRSPKDFLATQEFAAGVVLDDGTVRITALPNTHFNLPPSAGRNRDQSYSLKFEGQGRTIVFTGDTGPTAELSDFAKGADILVAEMASLEDRAAVPPMVRSHMDMEHLSPLEVGKLAAAANVKMLVLSHVGVVSDADLAVVRSSYSGKVVLGSDLARLTF